MPPEADPPLEPTPVWRGRSELAVHPLISQWFSPRAYAERSVTDEELELLMEAARWAPSSMNEQPWRFLVTRNGGEGHAALLATLNHSNAIWADKAPVLTLVMASRNLHRLGQENHHARHDVGAAVALLTLQAAALGMGIHQLGGFDPQKAREVFAIPDELDLISVLAIGFPGLPHQLPENLRIREEARSPRKPLAEIVHYGRFTG